jgi:hypothetical protein
VTLIKLELISHMTLVTKAHLIYPTIDCTYSILIINLKLWCSCPIYQVKFMHGKFCNNTFFPLPNIIFIRGIYRYKFCAHIRKLNLY